MIEFCGLRCYEAFWFVGCLVALGDLVVCEVHFIRFIKHVRQPNVSMASTLCHTIQSDKVLLRQYSI